MSIKSGTKLPAQAANSFLAAEKSGNKRENLVIILFSEKIRSFVWKLYWSQCAWWQKQCFHGCYNFSQESGNQHSIKEPARKKVSKMWINDFRFKCCSLPCLSWILFYCLCFCVWFDRGVTTKWDCCFCSILPSVPKFQPWSWWVKYFISIRTVEVQKRLWVVAWDHFLLCNFAPLSSVRLIYLESVC